jgi:hypothetical protein
MSGALLTALLAAHLPVSLAERLDADVLAKRPLVAHVIVALCDNDHQGIVPVPRALGDGSNPRTNLYWGARFGVKTFLAHTPGWRLRGTIPAPGVGVLERIVLTTEVRRAQSSAILHVVADAWDGRCMKEALAAFIDLASGRQAETIHVGDAAFEAGGAAHLMAFVGHNGLMDSALPRLPEGTMHQPRGAMVLACASAPYFADLLTRAGAEPVVLTQGLMAPEAYTLEAVLRAVFSGAKPAEVSAAAATAYDHYQHCGLGAARRLFGRAAESP